MSEQANPIVIDTQIRELIPPLTQEELRQLEDNLRSDGCIDPLIIWKGKNILLDGHHRLEICRRHNIPYQIRELELSSMGEACDWVDAHQLGRRNLTPDQTALLRGRRYNRLKGVAQFPKGASGNPGGKEKAEGDHFDPPQKTAEKLAHQYGVSAPTIKRDGKFAEAVGRVGAIMPELPQKVAAGLAPPRKTVIEAANLLQEHPDRAKSILSGQSTQAQVKRELKREQIITKLQNTASQDIKPINRQYDVIVIDPPWPMKKIERDERPNQSEFDYPTMNEEELSSLHIPCAGNCHVFLWTTQKYLPMALRLLQNWQLNYICTFVWHKPGGFQPFGLPQYNCEFALYARRGTPVFIDTKAFSTCFSAPRGRHSEKPETFYNVLRRVTCGQRLDMFNRRVIEGFDTWGKEAACFQACSLRQTEAC